MKYRVEIEVENKETAQNLRDRLYYSELLTDTEKSNLGISKIEVRK